MTHGRKSSGDKADRGTLRGDRAALRPKRAARRMLTRVLPGGMIVAAALAMPEFPVGAGDPARGERLSPPPEPPASKDRVAGKRTARPELAGVRYAPVLDLGIDFARAVDIRRPEAFAAPSVAGREAGRVDIVLAAMPAPAPAPKTATAPLAPPPAPVTAVPPPSAAPIAALAAMPAAAAPASDVPGPADAPAPSSPGAADPAALAAFVPEEQAALRAPTGASLAPRGAPLEIALPAALARAPAAALASAPRPAAKPAAAAAAAPAPAAAAAAVVPKPAPALAAPASASAPRIADYDVKSRLITRIDGRSAGALDFQQTPAGLRVRLGSVVEVLADRFDGTTLARIRASAAGGSYLTLAELQAQGIPISYDPVYDEFNIGHKDTRPRDARKVHIEQIGTPERGAGATAIDQVRR